MLATLLQYAISDYGLVVLDVGPDMTGYLLAAIGIGIGIGSVAAGYLSGGKIEYGLVPLGAAGMTVLSLLFSRGPDFATSMFLVAVLGFAGGFFAVPVMAIIQHRPDPARKGGVIAASNQLSFIGVGLASLIYGGLKLLHFCVPAVFLFGGVMTLIATIYAIKLMPTALIRLLVWILIHSVYRMRIQGRENIPAKGGALLVANHLSLVDALLLGGSTERPLRFLIFKGLYDRPIIGLIARAVRAIPISSEQRPREMIRSLRTASEAIRHGEIVCIFAEGQMTRIGQLLPFRRGFERIMKNVDAPIIPVHLDGVWGSIFSFERGRFLWKVPRRALASHHRELWDTVAVDGNRGGSAPGRAGTSNRSVQRAWETAEAAALRLHQNGTAPSLPRRHGRRQQAASLRRRADARGSAGAKARAGMGTAGDGRDPASPVPCGRGCQLRRSALREGSSQPELHAVERGHCVLRAAVLASRPSSRRRRFWSA